MQVTPQVAVSTLNVPPAATSVIGAGRLVPETVFTFPATVFRMIALPAARVNGEVYPSPRALWLSKAQPRPISGRDMLAPMS